HDADGDAGAAVQGTVEPAQLGNELERAAVALGPQLALDERQVGGVRVRRAFILTARTHLMRGSRGSPRMRSPIWLRLISEVPPANDMPRCMSTSLLLIPPGPSMNAPSGPLSSGGWAG